MRKQWLCGGLAALVLLLSLGLAACQPITASGGKAGMAVAQAAADNTEEVNKAAVRGNFAEYNALDPHDLAGFDRMVDKYYAPDYVLHDPGVPNFSGGTATLKKLIHETVQTMPDAHFTAEKMIAEGDWVAIRVRVSGTQPDGKPLSFTTMNMVRFVKGQWAEEWELVETRGMMSWVRVLASKSEYNAVNAPDLADVPGPSQVKCLADVACLCNFV